MATDFANFFNNLIPTSQTVSEQTIQNIPVFSPGYVQSNFDLIAQKMTKFQSTYQNNLLDYAYLETDENFSKSNPSTHDDMNKIMGQFSTSTQLVHMTNMQYQTLNISEYFPTTMSSLLLNYESMMNTKIDSSSILQQNTSSKILAEGLAADLLTQITGGNIEMSQLLEIYNNANTYFKPKLPTLNASIGRLLPSILSSIVPASLSSVLELSLKYADILEQSFATQPQTVAFNTNLNKFIANQESLPVSSFVTSSSYNNINVTTADPFGLNIHNQLSTELTNKFSANLTIFLTEQSVLNISDMHDVIMTNFTTNFQTGMQSKGLPRVTTSIVAVHDEVFNTLGTEIKISLNNLVSTIFTTLGAILPSGTNISNIDHLFNLHRHLSERIRIKIMNDTTINTQIIDKLLSPYFANGTYTIANIETLYQKIEAFNGR